MEILRRADFLSLLQKPEGVAVSIFMPTHRIAGSEGDPLALRHLLDKAETGLISRGYRTPEARELLEPARGLLRDALFWQRQDESLALFISPKSFHYFNLPVVVPETVIVADEFYVKPLLGLSTDYGNYYLLSLSLKHTALFQCRQDDCRELVPAKMPRSIDEALRIDDDEKQRQYHSASPGRGTEGRTRFDAHQFHAGGRAAIISHAQGETGDFDETRLLHYCQLIDRGLRETLRDENAPLVLASVEYLQPIFRRASSYANILTQGVEGNPDRMNPDVLQRQAWAVVQPYYQQEREKRLAQYIQATGTGPSIDDIAQIIPAAADGRVYSLFVAEGFELWGIFDAAQHRVRIDKEPAPDSYDLVEFLVKQALLKGASVYTLKPDDMPSSTGAAAVLRY